MTSLSDSQLALAEALPSVIWTATADGAVDYANPAFERYTGRSITASGGWLAAIHPDDHAGTLAIWSQCVATGSPYKTEFRVYHADSQSFRWHQVSALPHRGPDGTVERWFGVTLDLHDSRADEERFRAIAQASGDVLWDYNVEQDTIWYSEGLQRIFGHEPDDPAVTSATAGTRLIHPEDRPAVVKHIIEATAKGRQWRAEYRFRRADDSYAHVINRAVVLSHPNGRPRRVLGSITDVSDQKQLEAQLQRAQRLEAVGQLTGGIAHDFNNLLTIILGNADQLAEDPLSHDERRQLATEILGAARKGADVTRKLLAFARKQVLQAQAVDLHARIRDLQPLLGKALGERTPLHLELAPGQAVALVDPGQFDNALLNLALNARDAMPNGGTLTLRTRTQHRRNPSDAAEADADDIPPGYYIHLSVIDTGCGMSAHTAEKVFEPFFTTKPVGEGSGLGLSMVYGFVKQSQGFVRFESTLGRGTAVHLMFPRHEAVATADATTARVPLQAGSEHVLIVEDDPLVQQYLAGQFQHLGYAISVAGNAREALQALHQQPTIRLLFTDMIMPGTLDGYDLAQEARQHWPQLPVILSSGYAERLSRFGERTQEGFWVLPKPFLRAELARKVRQALQDSGH